MQRNTRAVTSSGGGTGPQRSSGQQQQARGSSAGGPSTARRVSPPNTASTSTNTAARGSSATTGSPRIRRGGRTTSSSPPPAPPRRRGTSIGGVNATARGGGAGKRAKLRKQLQIDEAAVRIELVLEFEQSIAALEEKSRVETSRAKDSTINHYRALLLSTKSELLDNISLLQIELKVLGDSVVVLEEAVVSVGARSSEEMEIVKEHKQQRASSSATSVLANNLNVGGGGALVAPAMRRGNGHVLAPQIRKMARELTTTFNLQVASNDLLKKQVRELRSAVDTHKEQYAHAEHTLRSVLVEAGPQRESALEQVRQLGIEVKRKFDDNYEGIIRAFDSLLKDTSSICYDHRKYNVLAARDERKEDFVTRMESSFVAQAQLLRSLREKLLSLKEEAMSFEVGPERAMAGRHAMSEATFEGLQNFRKEDLLLLLQRCSFYPQVNLVVTTVVKKLAEERAQFSAYDNVHVEPPPPETPAPPTSTELQMSLSARRSPEASVGGTPMFGLSSGVGQNNTNIAGSQVLLSMSTALSPDSSVGRGGGGGAGGGTVSGLHPAAPTPLFQQSSSSGVNLGLGSSNLNIHASMGSMVPTHQHQLANITVVGPGGESSGALSNASDGALVPIAMAPPLAVIRQRSTITSATAAENEDNTVVEVNEADRRTHFIQKTIEQVVCPLSAPAFQSKDLSGDRAALRAVPPRVFQPESPYRKLLEGSLARTGTAILRHSPLTSRYRERELNTSLDALARAKRAMDPDREPDDIDTSYALVHGHPAGGGGSGSTSHGEVPGLRRRKTSRPTPMTPASPEAVLQAQKHRSLLNELAGAS